MDIGKIIKRYYEQLHAHKLDDFNEKNQFLERDKQLNLRGEIGKLNSSIFIKEMEQ